MTQPLDFDYRILTSTATLQNQPLNLDSHMTHFEVYKIDLDPKPSLSVNNHLHPSQNPTDDHRYRSKKTTLNIDTKPSINRSSKSISHKDPQHQDF